MILERITLTVVICPRDDLDPIQANSISPVDRESVNEITRYFRTELLKIAKDRQGYMVWAFNTKITTPDVDSQF